MLSPFWEIRMADIIDILLVTALFYAALVLIRRTRAAFVAIGILILGGLYITASALDLRLTSWIFQGFFAVFLIIIVIIFQEELRQLFERVALWSLGRRETTTIQADPTDAIVKCLADFARDKIGALIVIPGTQPVQRHIEGGIELNGRLSLPLLKSLFDTHSPGHDGAVILESDRISRFAAHLPLSRDFAQLSRVGTRHSAALGLAERTDALCLIVSEERGEISVARDGRLRALASPQDLGAVVQEFLRDKHPRADHRHIWTQLVRENWVEKAAALALVIALWYLFVPGSRPVQFTYKVPVTVQNLPSEFELEEVDPPTVEATFTGLRRAFYLFTPERLQITIDASLAKLGRRTFRLSDDNLRYPKDLALQELRPPEVKLSLRKISVGADAGPAGRPSSRATESTKP